MTTPSPRFFPSPASFRAWLEKHHASVTELVIGFYKKGSGRGGLTYAEAVDEALCFGWIDGIVRRIDDVSYSHRFTPRKAGSIWSNINVGHVARLSAAGRMQRAGLDAFAARSAARTGIYSFENRDRARALPPEYEARFRANRKAWAFFTAQAPWYQRTAVHKIIAPKLAATRERWLARIIKDSAAGRRLAALD